MKQQLRLPVLMSSILVIALLGAGCSDSPSPTSQMTSGSTGFLEGQWCATEIEGAADPYYRPQQPCAVSTWTFNGDGTYQWFLHASPYYVLDGSGTYSLDGTALTVSGIIADTLFSYTMGSQDVLSLEVVSDDMIRFRDEDHDRWTFERQ